MQTENNSQNTTPFTPPTTGAVSLDQKKGTNPSSTNKIIWLSFFLSIFLISLIASLSWVYYSKVNKTNDIPEKRLSQTSEPELNNNQILLPLEIDKYPVQGFELYFSYNATIENIVDVKEGKEILTDIKSPHTPRFIIKPGIKTNYYRTKSNKSTPVSLADLQPGQKVTLEIYYVPAHSTWMLLYVFIEEPADN